MLGRISPYLPSFRLASPTEVVKNARQVVIVAIALSALANLQGAQAGPVAGFFAGLGTAVAGGLMVGAGFVLAPTGVGTALMAAGGVVIGKAPLVAVVVGSSPTP